MNQTIELPVGIAMDMRAILTAVQDRPAWVAAIERELQAGPGLINNVLDHLRPAIDSALGD